MAGPTPQLPIDLHSILGDFFGPMFAGHLATTIELTEEEAIAGVTRDVSFDRSSACTTCGGRGSANPDAIITVCKACKGAGTRAHAQGFFQIEATCNECKGNARYVADPCVTCEGRGTSLQKSTQTVTVPAGVAHEQRLLLKGAGGLKTDGTRGDVYVTLLIAGRPRSKPPMVAELASPFAAPLPQARVHRSDQPTQRPFMMYGIVIAVIAVLLLLATIK
ncbi:MAG TPA: zinc finger domain-containing protein [Kofleriaceae bacterium]|jgi:hypothetical protein